MRPRLRNISNLAMIACFCLGTATARELSFEERVAAQAAIEKVYYSHQIGASRSFEEAVPRAVLERKVRIYLKQSVALEKLWHTPLTAEALDKELGRIGRNTRLPDRLREIYSALGEDPVLIRECFARPVLVDRLTRNFFASDERIHGPAADRPADVGKKETDSGLERSWDDWWRAEESNLEESHFRAAAVPDTISMKHETSFNPVVISSQPSGTPCEGAWDNGILEGLPRPTIQATAVWTGSQMIIWGGVIDTDKDIPGQRYDPATDSWSLISGIGAPQGRRGYSAIWTGSRVVIWGGDGAGGGQYDPVADSWTPVSTLNGPGSMSGHSAVWTGNLMVVWYGFGNRGGRYDPSSDLLLPMTTSGAPSRRSFQTTVWTGTEMVIWGGQDTGQVPGPYLNTGGRYNPATNTWVATSLTGAPSVRSEHVAVWTDNRMVVWGGYNGVMPLATGGQYDPTTNSWSAVQLAPSARYLSSALWTGSQMLVFGGADNTGLLTAGARYEPVSDTWTDLSD